MLVAQYNKLFKHFWAKQSHEQRTHMGIFQIDYVDCRLLILTCGSRWRSASPLRVPTASATRKVRRNLKHDWLRMGTKITPSRDSRLIMVMDTKPQTHTHTGRRDRETDISKGSLASWPRYKLHQDSQKVSARFGPKSLQKSPASRYGTKQGHCRERYGYKRTEKNAFQPFWNQHSWVSQARRETKRHASRNTLG